MPPPLITSETSKNGATLIKVEGPMALSEPSLDLESAILAGPLKDKEILLDLGSVTEINTLGAAALLDLLSQLRAQGGSFKFLSVSPPVGDANSFLG